MGITVGIDLGTTNSVVCIKKVNVTTIRNAEGDELTPSSVTAVSNSDDTSFELIVGRNSRDLLKQYPEQTVTSIKRLIGRDFEDSEVQKIIKNTSYKVTTEVSEPGSIRIPLGGKMQTPEMISGIILRKLIQDGANELQGAIDQAVVTVPAYFSDRQKFATRAACDYAGIKLLRLLPEPTAAALSFGLEELGRDESRTIMVFDLGGGTFDISILSYSGGSFMEITKSGDMWLGGDNIDKLLVDHVFACVEKSTHCKSVMELIERLSLSERARFLVEIKEKAEAAKIALSSEESATVEMFGVLKDEKNELIDIDVTITRTEFAKLLDPIVSKISSIAEQILHEIRFEPELIDTVLMVGGTSLVPAIQDELKNMFGSEKVMVHPRPMLAIAEGAALMATKMISQNNSEIQKPFSIMYSVAHDYYLKLAGGKKHLLVARNTPLPVAVEEKLTFSHDEQLVARIRVLNEVDGILDTVGELWFHKDEESNPNKKNECMSFMLRFSVDENNIIAMRAWPLQKEGKSVETEIARGGLAAKLYSDLECSLSSIIANCQDYEVEYDAINLSRRVVSTILSASDPITGETRAEQKLKAEQQIETLKTCQQKNIAPLSIYGFAQFAQTASKDALSKEEMAQLTEIIEDFKVALESLDNVSKFEHLEERLDKFYSNVPIAKDLARAENSASIIEDEAPGDARKIRDQAKALVAAYSNQNKELVEDAKHVLYELIHSNVYWGYSPPSGRFDRDVCL